MVNFSSAFSFIMKAASWITFSISWSLFLGTSRLGNRSEMRPRKIGLSSATILGRLKSLRALMRTCSSGLSRSLLLRDPATTSTDLMALRPQS